MRGRPSSCLGNRHLKRGEIKVVCEDVVDLKDWSMSHYLRSGDSHEIGFTKKLNEIH